MAPALIQRLVAALPGKQIVVMYGATERRHSPTFLPRYRIEAGSIGRAIPNVELRLLKEDGRWPPPAKSARSSRADRTSWKVLERSGGDRGGPGSRRIPYRGPRRHPTMAFCGSSGASAR